MAAPNSLSKDFNAFLTTTLEYYRETMADNIFRSNATLAMLRNNDQIVRQSGGNEIVQPLMYGKNNNVSSYKGYEELETDPQDGITAAEFDWKQIAGTVTISRRERRLNSGEEQLLNLFQKKVQQAEMTMQEEVNNQLINAFSPGNNSKDLTPIPNIIPDDPTTGTGSSVGDIDGANESWWRNKNTSSGATTLDGLKEELYSMYNDCSRGGMNSRPDVVLMDQGTFERYEMGLDQRTRYQNQNTGDIGFEQLQLKGATAVWDEVVPDAQNGTVFDTSSAYDESSNPSTGTAYFIDTNFMQFVVDSETEFVSTEFQKPPNQDAFVSQILFMGELTVDNRRKHGVLYDINRI